MPLLQVVGKLDMTDTVPPTQSSPTYGDSIGPRIVRVNTAMIIISTLAVSLRCWSRALKTEKKFWWDDWTCLAAYVRRKVISYARFLGLIIVAGVYYLTLWTLLLLGLTWFREAHHSHRPHAHCIQLEMSIRGFISLQHVLNYAKVLSTFLLLESLWNIE